MEKELPACPKCGHDGDGVNWCYPDDWSPIRRRVQIACLSCGFHGEPAGTNDDARRNFLAGMDEVA